MVDTSNGAGGGEYEWISAAISDAGYTVTPFDGGDGSAAAWTAALADVDVFVLPEQESGMMFDPASPPSWMSVDAKDALVDWIRAGGAMVLSSACSPGNEVLLSEAVGVDYSDTVDCNSFDSAPRSINDSALPSSLRYADGSYTLTLTGMSAEQLAPLTVWYAGISSSECSSEPVDVLAAGVFAAGSGRVAFEAWDYYNDSSADQADWNAVLAGLIDGNSAASNWAPSVTPSDPPAKEAITATTASGGSLYTISAVEACSDEHSLFRVDPGTGLAAPVGSASIAGEAGQGAWDLSTDRAYFPFYDYEADEYTLRTIDPVTGAFGQVGAFTTDDFEFYTIYSMAIGPDGRAYLFADGYVPEVDEGLALFSVDLSTAALTFITFVDDEELDEPNGFAADPRSGRFYAFEEDSRELFQVDVATGALTSVGTLDASSMTESSDVTALQIGDDGTFWVVFDEADEDFEDAGMLATFSLSDISGGVFTASEVGILTDDPISSYSLLVVPGGAAELAATGSESSWSWLLAVLALFAGAMLLVAVRSVRRHTV